VSLDIEPIKSRSYTVEQVDRALLVLAMNGGNSLRAADELADQGIEIDDSTLRLWKSKHYPRRYLHIQEQYGRRLEDVLVAQQREIAIAASLKALEGIQQIDFNRIDHRDKARSVQALQTTAGIGTDKVLTLTGRPTAVVQHQDSSAVLRKYGGRVIEGTAEELTSEPSATPGQLIAGTREPNAHE